MIFPLVSWAAIYFVIWWITLFAILPFGMRSQFDAGEVIPGTEPSAPVRLRGWRIVGLTTLAATGVFLFVFWLLTQSHFTLDDVPFFPKFEQV
ncbi:DUF1467 family protein [Methylopila sp. Yamaguchi]|uniref:DUF1467 family protein n=1 Tax=Methylopila sp. Yamaguchi TaxID=1437817 RepID=UPI000CC2166A|nr:DUF1467 family protein [Methylopila sp. Yamaguchi]GBD47553.1 hypothetical protein METY_0766 [Methylopila sp. Yamaguchi]